MLLDKAKLKRARRLIKHREQLFFRVENNYFTIGAWGADRSILFAFEFSGNANSAL